MATQVILLKDVENIGMQGDTVSVADGYARNFLLPRQMAIPATAGNLRRVADLKRRRAELAAKEADAAKIVAEKISSLTCTLALQLGEDGKAFGAVTAQDIVEALKAAGVEVQRKQVVMEHPIKQLGETEVSIKLHPEVTAQLKITVAKK